jgi:hypothetical protein
MKRIEVNEKYRGYEYLVYATPMGHRCGYVRIPSKHFLYKKPYGIRLKKFSVKKDMNDLPVGKRNPIDIFCAGISDNPTISLLFDVHGGITWSDWGKNNSFEKPGWWIGFDCIHSGDAIDPDILDEERASRMEYFNENEYRAIRTKECVQKECKNLIDQIIKYFDKEQP